MTLASAEGSNPNINLDGWKETWPGFKLEIRKTQGIAVVDIWGNLVHGDAIDSMRRAVAILEREGEHYVVLNLWEANRIDSAGLGAITVAIASCLHYHGAIALVSPRGKDYLGRLLIETKLNTLAPVFDREANATEDVRRRKHA